MRRVVMLGVGIIMLGIASGCATKGHWYHDQCAWCKGKIASTQAMGEAPMTNERYKQWKKSMISRDDEGHEFCSLRCLNAYKASTGIKEQRHRQIFGE